MHLALAEKAHVAHVGPVLDRERGIFLDDLGQRAREAHVVLAVLDANREGEDRLGRRNRGDGVRPRLAGSEAIAGGDRVEPGEAKRLALFCLGDARGGGPDERLQASDPGL
jgi:hypothetical protein